ncbi:hypothetical protein B9G69_003885 [Bdellovibrio sp. SKB1291214]|uniref:hypothetical protein n=1 Tax=Bdellovibrio sp. SKB1291214 TaxID=1732569 RepID=UPI000B517221|nr:hypothetical protein [Bdellovibrio sp. SKB1291214]UYL09714.1 hypothetical protein B9G69_003885 [Bdellovibrio sp. SKB1291214]
MQPRILSIILILLALSPAARADFMFEVSGTYITEKTGATDVKDDATKYFYNVAGYLDFGKKWWAGWSYLGVNMAGTSNASGSNESTSFQSSDTGPAIRYYFGKNQVFSMTAVFNVLSKASFKNVVTDKTESWNGTSYLVSFGLMPEVKSGFHIGVAINYYSASYSKKTVDGTETSESNTKTWMFPSLALSKTW